MKEGLRRFARPLGTVAVIAVIAIAYFLARASRGGDDGAAANVLPPDPGYAARDAEVIETGYDGRERYRLKAKVIRQQIDSSMIDIEQLDMDYHLGAQDRIAGESRPTQDRNEIWHLRSDHGQVRANGDDVELFGNVQVRGPAPADGSAPLTLSTARMRINTPTEFIETDAPVILGWSGHEMTSKGMKADLKAGTLRLESDVHGEFSPK